MTILIKEMAERLSTPIVTVNVSPAVEGDLLDAVEVVRTGREKVALQKWIGRLRQAENAPAAPFPITIVNASEVGAKDKTVTIKRNDSGQMVAAEVSTSD